MDLTDIPRSSFFDKVYKNNISLAVSLCDDILFCRGETYIWKDEIRRWVRSNMKKTKEIMIIRLEKYFSKYSKKQLPCLNKVCEQLRNDLVDFNNMKNKCFTGNNVIYDKNLKSHRNVQKEDFILVNIFP